MTTSILINALGQAIFESVGQALLVYVALQVLVQLFPGITSKYKYDANYLGLTIICCWFMANLLKIYLHNVAMANYAILSTGNNLILGVTHAPSLLQQAESLITQYAKYIAGLYMIGLILQAIKLTGGFVHIHHIRKQKNLQTDISWTNKAQEICKNLKIVKTVSLYFSEHISIPLTIGYLKPIIIFPLSLINNLDNNQVEAILMHELSHIKRHDYLLNILQCIMETILCFNPFVWLISKTIRLKREHCCDDMVIDADYNNFTYSKALLVIAQQNSQHYALAMASAGNKKYPLLNRIKRLNTMETKDSLPKFNLLAIITIAAIGTLLAWGIPQYSTAKTTAKKAHKISFFIKETTPTAHLTGNCAVHTSHKKKFFALYTDTATAKILDDTTKKKFKIVIEDDKGDKKEYRSLSDMPASDKKEFLEENPSFDFKFDDSMRFASAVNFKMTPEFKKQMFVIKMNAKKLQEQFNSPQWKKQIKDMQIQAEKMGKQANSAEWRKQREEMRDQAEKMKAQFDSPEWKKQLEDMKVQAKKMSEQYVNSPEFKKQMVEIKLQAEHMSKQFSSDQLKKQRDELRGQLDKLNKQFNSPEWKKQMEDMQKNIQDEVNKNLKNMPIDSTKSAN
ncbi:M56 family metallopeptidase [Mucilaginibacter sp. L196]|uniref:M56 family metallopeptidase n=1 Tax=Mucilaginibacter sp. L196 TaxID=1641870 RepID=UPI00131EB388|nr:M56 family metallopeptidase [Mucilaginibacter sp. L196]